MLLDGSLNWWSMSYQTACWDIAPPYHFISSQPLNCRLTNALFASLSIWIKHFRCSSLMFPNWPTLFYMNTFSPRLQPGCFIHQSTDGGEDRLRSWSRASWWDHQVISVRIHRDDRINQRRRKKQQSSDRRKDRTDTSEQEVTRL